MKNQNKIIVGLIVMVACLTFLIGGCTAQVAVQHPDGSTTTNHVVDPNLTTGITIARASNAASAPFNPYSPLVEIGLGLVAAGAGWYAKRKNDAAGANELLIKTLVQAINQLSESDAATIKPLVQDHAKTIGVEGDLNTFVKRVESGLI